MRISGFKNGWQDFLKINLNNFLSQPLFLKHANSPLQWAKTFNWRGHSSPNPHLHNAAIAHDADYIGPLDGAQPVGDDEHSATPCGPVQSFLHHPLWLSIECAGGFIEHEDAGVLDQSSGDGDPLFLAPW